MTREEEICKAAEEFAFSPKTETPNFHDAINDFYYGAKWADENQPGMSKMRKDYELLFLLKKKELITKAKKNGWKVKFIKNFPVLLLKDSYQMK